MPALWRTSGAPGRLALAHRRSHRPSPWAAVGAPVHLRADAQVPGGSIDGGAVTPTVKPRRLH